MGLDIGDDEIDVVIEHNQELTRYDYLLFINDIEYAQKCNVSNRKTGGMKQTLTTKDISSKELKKKNKKKWAERNKLKVAEEKEKKRKVQKKTSAKECGKEKKRKKE